MAMTPEELREFTDRVRRIRAVVRKQPVLLPKPEPEGNQAEDDLNREAERRAGVRYNRLPAYYAQLPDKLITSHQAHNQVSSEAIRVYALLHKHAPIKNLNRHPKVEISQETLAEELNCSTMTVHTLINELVEKGWISKHRQGKMLVNKYVLYPMSKETWQTYVGMERVQVRIQRDSGLAKRLRESLHPISDQRNSLGHLGIKDN